MGLDTTAKDMVQAVLEGIAYRAAEVLLTMADYVPIDGAISIDGGVSSNPYFCQFLANALGRDIKVQESAELTVLGTAMLASEHQIEPGRLSAENKIYAPEQDYRRYLDRYVDAVGRSKQWLS